MFWEKFSQLCQQNGVKPNNIAKEIGVTSGTITAWKNGTIPNGLALTKVAERFNTTIDYLISDEEIYIKPSSKKEFFTTLNALPQRWVSLRCGKALTTIEIMKIAKFSQTDIPFLYSDSLNYSNIPSKVSFSDYDTLELILGIFDRCADDTSLKLLQIQLSRIVLFRLNQKGFDINTLISDPKFRGVSDAKLKFLNTGVPGIDPTFNYGLNFTELDVLREETGLSFLYMFTGVNESPAEMIQKDFDDFKQESAMLKYENNKAINELQKNNSELKKENSILQQENTDLKARLAKYEKIE